MPGSAVTKVLTENNENDLLQAIADINLKCIIVTPNTEEKEILASYLYEYVKNDTNSHLANYTINNEKVEVYYLNKNYTSGK